MPPLARRTSGQSCGCLVKQPRRWRHAQMLRCGLPHVLPMFSTIATSLGRTICNSATQHAALLSRADIAPMSPRTAIDLKGHLICGVAGRCMRASRRCWMPSQPSRCRGTSRCCARAGLLIRSTVGVIRMCPLAPRLQMWRPCRSRWWGLPHPHARDLNWLARTKAGPSLVPQVSDGASMDANCQLSYQDASFTCSDDNVLLLLHSRNAKTQKA